MTSFDKIVILSQEEKRYLSKIGLKEKKAINISVAVNEVFLRSSSSNSSDRSYILYVGRIDPYKGIDALAKAVKELQLINVHVKCVIVGRDYGYRSKLESLIDELRISNIVEIRDHVSQENVVELYSSALVTVLPSLSEGFPLTLVESMALGTPFIASSVGAIPELVALSKAGILVPINNAKVLAQTIRNLLEDKELWSILSVNGKRFARNFTWEKIAKSYFDLYSEMTH
jgi:D-inositol-3-phosphate glycosyltransferase